LSYICDRFTLVYSHLPSAGSVHQGEDIDEDPSADVGIKGPLCPRALV
jgi:hypothetical protein